MRVRSVLCGLALVAAASVSSSSALAFSVAYDFTGPDWFTPDWVGQGSSHWANDGAVTPPTRLRLTSAAGGQTGSAWLNSSPATLNPQSIDPSQPWNAEFTWQITFEGGGGADGLGFHLQTQGTGANTPFTGGGIVGNHLSVGIDTWNNNEGPDPGGSFHMEVNFNGAQVGGNVDLSGLGPIPNDVYQMVLSYDGAGNLTVNVINTANLNQTGNQNFSVNLAGFGPSTVGFSANTGGAVENHDIRTFSGTFLVPEPTTALLLGMGLAGLGWGGRRRA